MDTVLVVGAGVVGASAAHRLAPDHDVVVLDRDQVAAGATAKASGLISPQYDLNAHLDAASYALDAFRDLDGTGHFEYTERRGVSLVREGELADDLRMVENAREAGLGAHLYDIDEAADRLPDAFDLSPFAAVAVYEEGGWVDSYTLATTLLAEAEADGAEVVTGRTVEDVRIDDGRVVGVTTDDGRIDADHVVVAAGWRTRDLLAEHLAVPVRPFRYQTADLSVDVDVTDFPVAWEHETLLYWRPTRGGDLHVGGQPYFVDRPGSVRTQVRPSFREALARDLPEYLPGLGDPRIRSTDTCLTGDAATPDGVPILDAPPEAPDGLVVATGMHGFGIMLSPVAGAAVRAHVTGESAPFDPAPYRLDRFENRGTDFDSTYID